MLPEFHLKSLALLLNQCEMFSERSMSPIDQMIGIWTSKLSGDGWDALYTCEALSILCIKPKKTVRSTTKATVNQKLNH